MKAEAEEKAQQDEAAAMQPEQPEPAEPDHAEPEVAAVEAEEPELDADEAGEQETEVEEPEAAEAEVPEAEAAEAEEPEIVAEADMPQDETSGEVAEDVETTEIASEDEGAGMPADIDDGAEAPDDEDATSTEEAAVVAKPETVRRTLDDAVKNVLREEAERETRARRAEGGPLESQPELGIAAAIGAAAAVTGGEEPDRVVRVRGDESDLDDDALVSRASRRELLPDIEEINSTLRATSERDGEPAAIDAPETVARRRSGFRMGFSTALLIAVILLGLYVLAPVIVSRVPAAEPALTSYVASVDAARSWLDVQMKSLTQSLKGGPDGG